LISALLLIGVGACSAGTTPVSNDAGAQEGGPSVTGSATVNGTLGGQTLHAVDAVALKGAYDSSYPGIVTIFIANVPDLCSLLKQTAAVGASNTAKANLFDIGFTLGATEATSTVVAGTYTPSSQPNELDTAGWDSYDATCKVTHDPGYSAATVTLTSVGAVYAGTFDMAFNGGDHVTGSFSAPLCDVSSAASAGDAGKDAGPVCLP